MEFVEAPAFTRHVSRYLDQDEYQEFQSELAHNPECGDVMPGTGGFRKLRWPDPRRGKGQRGGLRIIYYYFAGDHQIWLMTLYGKDEAADLTGRGEEGVAGCYWRRTEGQEQKPQIATEQIRQDAVMAKREIFGELMEGVNAMKRQREGKLTLRSYKIDSAPLPTVDSKLIRDTRRKLDCSRAVFARQLRINERTLEKWEQGRAKPNPQAAALVLLVRKYPDTLERLEQLAVTRTATAVK